MLSIEVSSSKADAIPTICKYIPQQVSVGTFDKSGKAGSESHRTIWKKATFFGGENSKKRERINSGTSP